MYQDFEETIHSAEKKLPHMKAFSLSNNKRQTQFESEKVMCIFTHFKRLFCMSSKYGYILLNGRLSFLLRLREL